MQQRKRQSWDMVDKSIFVKYWDVMQGQVFLEIVKEHTAGSPMNEEIKWTNLGQRAISKAFREKGYKVSEHVVKQLLKKHKYVQRKKQKTRTVKETALRNEQFKNIKDLREEYARSENPIISIDVKKKS